MKNVPQHNKLQWACQHVFHQYLQRMLTRLNLPRAQRKAVGSAVYVFDCMRCSSQGDLKPAFESRHVGNSPRGLTAAKVTMFAFRMSEVLALHG